MWKQWFRFDDCLPQRELIHLGKKIKSEVVNFTFVKHKKPANSKSRVACATSNDNIVQHVLSRVAFLNSMLFQHVDIFTRFTKRY